MAEHNHIYLEVGSSWDRILMLVRPIEVVTKCAKVVPLYKINTFSVMFEGTPYKFFRDSIGPNTRPCGTPVVYFFY